MYKLHVSVSCHVRRTHGCLEHREVHIRKVKMLMSMYSLAVIFVFPFTISLLTKTKHNIWWLTNKCRIRAWEILL